MPKTLVIVESPAKISKLKSILGDKYEIQATYGHIYDLPPKGMNIDVNNDFKPTYEVIKEQKNKAGKVTCQDKTKVVKSLKFFASKCTKVILASDKDPEGEFIAWSLMKVLKLDEPERITFTEITKSEVLKAVEKGGKIDYDMVHSQQVRRMFDRLFGYDITKVIRKLQHNSTGGRVQTIVARIIIDRENEIKKFYDDGSDNYYKVSGKFGKNDLQATLFETKESKDSDSESSDNDEELEGSVAKLCKNSKTTDGIKKFLKKCQDTEFVVSSVFNKKRMEQPPPPFMTISLQQTAFNAYGLAPKDTMKLAQQLYEKGLITYMRTDSLSLSKESLDQCKKYICDKYDKDHYRFKIYQTRDKSAKEAHEAIRPTKISKHYDDLKLDGKLKSLYKLIWNRTVASQMAPAEYNVVNIQITSEDIPDYYFLSKIEQLKFAGFQALYNKEVDDSKVNLPKVGKVIEMNEIVATQEWSKPKARYTQSSLLSVLKKLKIGRPATYANMIQIVLDRNYAVIEDVKGTKIDGHVLTCTPDDIKDKVKSVMIGAEKKRFVPTELGIKINTFMEKHFGDVLNYKLTADLERELDDIRNGEKKWKTVLKKYHKMYSPKVITLLNEMKDDKDNKFDENCRILGEHDGYEISATIAQYGPVVRKKVKSKYVYAKIEKPFTVKTITLKDAIKLLKYPMTLGKHKKKDVVLMKGMYGLYITWNGSNYNVADAKQPTLERAVEIISAKEEKNEKEGVMKFEEGKITYLVRTGQFGPYVTVMTKGEKKGKNTGLPKDLDTKELTLEVLKDLIKERQNYKPKRKFVRKSKTTKN